MPPWGASAISTGEYGVSTGVGTGWVRGEYGGVYGVSTGVSTGVGAGRVRGEYGGGYGVGTG
jgi:hypothetical protein